MQQPTSWSHLCVFQQWVQARHHQVCKSDGYFWKEWWFPAIYFIKSKARQLSRGCWHVFSKNRGLWHFVLDQDFCNTFHQLLSAVSTWSCGLWLFKRSVCVFHCAWWKHIMMVCVCQHSRPNMFWKCFLNVQGQVSDSRHRQCLYKDSPSRYCCLTSRGEGRIKLNSKVEYMYVRLLQMHV